MGKGNLRKMILGEKMPDKDDPQYRDRYEKEVKAGMRFAELTHIDKAAARVQSFASHHRILFLAIVFSFVLFCFSLNVLRLITAGRRGNIERAAERQEQLLERKDSLGLQYTNH